MRWRILFCRGEELKFLSHLELMRLWERALRRAGVALAYSQGFSPHPRLSAASPLPVGISAAGELLDIYLKDSQDPQAFQEAIARELPAGLALKGIEVVAAEAPSLTSQLPWLHYRLWGQGKGVEDKVASFLSLEELPWEEVKRKGARRYNLRQRVGDIRIISSDPEEVILEMKLSPQGRPEQVARALGLEIAAIQRRALELA